MIQRFKPAAEIADVPCSAFASSPAHATHGRLIVHRVCELNPITATDGQGELFATYRYLPTARLS